MQSTIERATPDDAPAIVRLLSANALPLDGALEHLHHALVVRANDEVIGCAVLEVYDDGALLRSVAIDPTFQQKRIGTRLVTSALELALTLDVPAVYLLTTTAEGFFERLAFEAITRAEVPSNVLTSVEFRSACPTTATVMRKTYDRGRDSS